MNDFQQSYQGQGGVPEGDYNPCKLYVGNLPYSVNTQELGELFADFGKIVDAVVIMDKTKYNWSKGFGFVEYSNPEEAERAVEAMNDKEYKGRKLIVNVAAPKPSKQQGGGIDGFMYY